MIFHFEIQQFAARVEKPLKRLDTLAAPPNTGLKPLKPRC
jgi:hypothetical protein